MKYRVRISAESQSFTSAETPEHQMLQATNLNYAEGKETQPWQLGSRNKEEWPETLDQDHKLIYQRAVRRISKIYEDNTHYIHQKAPRRQGKQTKQHKKELVNQRRKAWSDNHHRWEPHRSGFQCTACGTRMHQGLTAEILEARLQEDCPQMLLDDLQSQPPMHSAPLPKKPTRAQHIKALLAKQPDQPAPGQHLLAETTGYLKCTQCGINIHKRVNEAAYTAFLQSPCVNQEFQEQHSGHRSHALWQIGEKVKCAQCGVQWNLDGHRRLIATQALHKACKGASTRGSPPLSDFFKKKDTPSGHGQGSASQAPDDLSARPTPKRLHFQTELDEQAREELNQQLSALAMNPSHPAAAQQTEDDKATIEVDFF